MTELEDQQAVLERDIDSLEDDAADLRNEVGVATAAAEEATAAREDLAAGVSGLVAATRHLQDSYSDWWYEPMGSQEEADAWEALDRATASVVW